MKLYNLLILFMLLPIKILAQSNRNNPDLSLDDKVNNYPNSLKIKVKRNVVDTAQAKIMYQQIKPSLMKDYESLVKRKNRCVELYASSIKKVKTEEDLLLLNNAYNYTLITFPKYRNYKQGTKVRNKAILKALSTKLLLPIPIRISNTERDEIYEVYDKDVEKGKLTDRVKEYLMLYSQNLEDSINQVYAYNENIEQNWRQHLPRIPKKKIIVEEDNPFYRGFHYNNGNTLDLLERYQQRKGWEFLYSESDRKEKHSTYPVELDYYVYNSAPNYKVTFSETKEGYEDKIIIKEVYDAEGKLVCVPGLDRAENFVFKDIERVVYLKDYQNNKYNIKSKSQHTQDYISLFLGRNGGFEKTYNESVGIALGSAFAGYMYGGVTGDYLTGRNKSQQYAAMQASKYIDSDGQNYIKQLVLDHESEFKYIYMIERVSNISFRVVYLNDQLKPSHCAIVTYKTGKKPFTCEYSTKLIDMPANIPPVHGGRLDW